MKFSLFGHTCGVMQVVEHDDGLLGELDEFDDLISPAGGSRGQLETTGSSMTATAGIVMEAAVSSAVMHTNVVQTYSYHTQRSALTGGQVHKLKLDTAVSMLAPLS